MGGRWTDDDDTHERHTDTNKLTRHTALERVTVQRRLGLPLDVACQEGTQSHSQKKTA